MVYPAVRQQVGFTTRLPLTLKRLQNLDVRS